MKNFLTTVIFTAAAFLPAAGGSRLEHHKIPVKMLQGVEEREYTILLPESYDSQPERTYPVLYLLHGGGDRNPDWAAKGDLVQIVDRLVEEGRTDEMIVVCPEGQDGRMIWFNMPGWNYGDHFFEELMPYMESNYRIKAEKRYRAVAGLSMGGGGAVVYGLQHPELFNMVYDMSGYLRRQELPFPIEDGFAEERQQCVEAHNPVVTVENGSREQIRGWRTVRWFVDCGDQDFTLEGNMDFVKALRAKDIPCEMRVRDGGHEWGYWKKSLEMALEYFSESMYKSKVVDGGGNGPYKAVAITERSLPDFVVYRPKDITYAAKTEGELPVLVFANGGCNNTSITHERVLNEIASEGYVVIALGDMQMNGCSAKNLTNFHSPVLYIIGDDEDVAYANAIKDYDRIKKVPVAFANLTDGGHMGTFAEPNGGSFARIAIQWLDWHLKGRISNSVVFLNGQLQDYPGWTIKTKNFKK